MKTFKLDAEIAQKTENVNFLGFKFRTIGPDSLEAFLKECAVGEKVKIEINSPGGSVIAGLAMANMIKNSKAHVIAHVVGVFLDEEQDGPAPHYRVTRGTVGLS